MYLSCDYNDLEQLQDQLKRLAALGVVFITGAHEEVFQLPAKGLLFLMRLQPVTCHRRRKLRVVVAVDMIITLTVVLSAAVNEAVVSHWVGQAFLF